MSKAVALIVMLGLVLGGCGSEHGEDGHDHGSGSSASITIPEHYAEAIQKCEELSMKIGDLIAKGRLNEVHPAAENIKKIAEKLPEMAQKELPADLLRDVNIKAKKLAGMFVEIDEPADAGNKEETIKVHNKMKGLIAKLKIYAKQAKEDHHEDH